MSRQPTQSPRPKAPKPYEVPDFSKPGRPGTKQTNPGDGDIKPPDPSPPESTLNYQEITIRIAANGDEKTLAQVVSSPYGASTLYEFKVPGPREHLDALLTSLENRSIITRSAKGARREAKLQQVREIREGLGPKLSEALFPNESRLFLQNCLSQVTPGQNGEACRGLRIRLLFDLASTEGGATEFNRKMAIPWDLLCDPSDTDRVLCRSPSYALTPLLYSFGSERPEVIPPRLVHPPLRVLLVLQSVLNAENVGLDLAAEKRRILAAVESIEIVEIDSLSGPSLEQLEETLRRERYDVLHFIGHGWVDETTKEAFLLFDKPDGTHSRYFARQLAALVQDDTSVQLVVFGTCLTAAADRESGTSPLLTAAGAFSVAGVPAVIGMRYTISDFAAPLISAELYAALAAGDDIDTALAEARAALPEEDLEWVTPVLFLNQADGNIYQIEKGDKTPGDRLALTVKSFEGYGHQQARESDRILSLLPSFEGRRVREGRTELWDQKIRPQLSRFLAQATNPPQPLLLQLPAHQTLAFAAGYLLQVKAGLDIQLLQRGRTGTETWHAGIGEVPQAPLWRPWSSPDLPFLDPEALDTAIAIGVTREVTDQVAAYLTHGNSQGPPPKVRTFLAATAAKVGNGAIENGAHAAAMADLLEAEVRRNLGPETGSRLHLFASAPNSFLFLLGQLAKPFKTIVLYEFDFESQNPEYLRSMTLP